MILFAVVRVRDLIVSIDYYGFCCKKIDIDHSVYQEWNVNYPGIPSFIAFEKWWVKIYLPKTSFT